MTPQSEKWSNLYFVVHDLGNAILKKIGDYETKIYENGSLKRDFYNIEFVYMHSILLDIAKLISATGSDQSGLKQLKKGAPSNILERICNVETNHRDLISKVKVNRNKIVAHVDITEMGSYHKLGLSDLEVERRIEDLKRYSKLTGDRVAIPQIIKDLENLKSISPETERYSPSDFFSDLDKFKQIAREILDIADELNVYFYTRIAASSK